MGFLRSGCVCVMIFTPARLWLHSWSVCVAGAWHREAQRGNYGCLAPNTSTWWADATFTAECTPTWSKWLQKCAFVWMKRPCHRSECDQRSVYLLATHTSSLLLHYGMWWFKAKNSTADTCWFQREWLTFLPYKKIMCQTRLLPQIFFSRNSGTFLKKVLREAYKPYPPPHSCTFT